MANKKQIAFIDRQIESTVAELGNAILDTPTGEVRELLTEANIFLAEAQTRLKNAWLKSNS